VSHFEIVIQERDGPSRGVIAQVAGILVDDLRDQRVDDAERRARAARPGGVPKTCSQIPISSLLKAFGPVIDRAATDLSAFRHLGRGFAFGQPEQRFRPAELSSRRRTSQDKFQISRLRSTQLQDSHCSLLETKPSGFKGILAVQELLAIYLNAVELSALNGDS
jgi:hypothetical protein